MPCDSSYRYADLAIGVTRLPVIQAKRVNGSCRYQTREELIVPPSELVIKSDGMNPFRGDF